MAGDALHNWGQPRQHFNWLGRRAFGFMGFIGPHKLGKGWLDQARPDPRRLQELLELPFSNVLPAHGDPVIGDAKELYRPAVEAYAASR